MKRTALRMKTRSTVLGPLVLSTLRQERKSFHAAPYDSERNHALFASYNVHKCVGMDGQFDPDRILAVIEELGADVVALQEADMRFGDRAGLLDLQALRRRSGLVPVPLTGTRKAHGWHGNVVLFREGVVTGAHQLSLPGVEPRGAVVVDLSMPTGPLRIIAAHLGLLRRCRARQVATILSAAKADDRRPVLLMGDLNEWRLGKRSSLQALEPTFGPLQATVASFPSRFPVWSLDRILANPHSLVSRIEVHDTPLARIASDHLPIKALIRFSDSADLVPQVDELAPAA
ncbi:MAG TPA: endonuclease/exonuclease/phosphatase family protein [Rhizobiaceae bacterium]|nr:endonuclease/exonuclease/phosphatase family protein [Rhizobiaceae bacterium]